MKVKVPDCLVQLAQIFAPNATLYVVGGAVRNSLLGYAINDYDITSKVLAEDAQRLLAKSEFEVVACYKRTGTLVIKKGNFKFEYTTFRQDSYPLSSGVHTPNQCTFTDNMLLDAKRRDFTCNALYYDILKDEIVDVVGGVKDIENKLLKTVREPFQTLREDALRIMRLVRFHLQLGFEIEQNTLDSAKKYAYQLKDISKERIKEELLAIFEAVYKYDSKSKGFKASDGIRLLVDIGAMEHIIPEVLDMIDMPQNTKYHIYDVYNHSLRAMDNLPPSLMMAGLLHDIAKPVMQKQFGNMYMHELKGEKMAKDILTRLKFSNAEIDRISKLVLIHMFNVQGNTKKSKCRVFIADNFEYFDDFVRLRRADGLATNPENYDDTKVQAMIELKNQMLSSGMPITIKDLPISGNDLLKLGYQGKEIGEMLCKIRLWILQNGKLPTKEEILLKLRRND
ncbi:MAG TPA: HD domain-containing protein [Clostridia bacterium]|nr:HD domain-containing protein [Clostridia bacterium]